MKTEQELKQLLSGIHKKGYPAYKSLHGIYQFKDYQLSIDHVQGDPFAAPSKLSVRIPAMKAAFPEEYLKEEYERTALADYLLRVFSRSLQSISFDGRKGSGKSGFIGTTRPGQEVLARTACIIEHGNITARFEVGFPAFGRTVNAQGLSEILFDQLPKCIQKAFFYQNLSANKIQSIITLAQDQQAVRRALKEQGLVAFIANGSILPRESGISQRPMKQAVPFQSPESMCVSIELPNRGVIRGMGIQTGITLIVGGGYHGKSTLLKALELGIYNHIEGDGREFVITDDTAMKIRAEEGRSITNVELSYFIKHLPNKKDTTSFYTEDASGSTSQAAAVMEAYEAGAGVLLIDEDTSATNFMVRDSLMQHVIAKGDEPITPYIERIRAIYEEGKISTILVAGSSGAFFYVADSVIQMNEYLPFDITEKVKEIRKIYEDKMKTEIENTIPIPTNQRLLMVGKHSREDRTKIKLLGNDMVSINKEMIDCRYLEQLVDTEQIMTMAYLLAYAIKEEFPSPKSLTEVMDHLSKLVQKKDLLSLLETSYYPTQMAAIRKQDLFAFFNRCRYWKQK